MATIKLIRTTSRELPGRCLQRVFTDLGKSKQRFEQQLEQLTTAKLRVAGLVNTKELVTRRRNSHMRRMKDIKHLDESITQV